VKKKTMRGCGQQKIMKVLFWNVRGLGGRKRRGQLKELIGEHRVDVICVLETMKREFALSELRNLVGGASFSWNWTA
jgi:exonuclease III